MSTKHIYLLLILCSALFPNTGTAQKVSFEIFVGSQFDNVPNYSGSYQVEAPSLRIINDSLAVRTFVTQEIDTKENYPTSKIGYQLGTRTVFRLNDKMELLTGFSVAFHAFTRTAETQINFSNVRVTTDTVKLQVGGGIFTPCVFDNQYSDITVDPLPKYSSLQLSIPLEFRYALHDRIRVSVGGYISTPIRSNIYRELITVEESLTNGVKHCKYVKSVENDQSGSGFRDLLFGVSAGLEYRLNRRIYMGANIQKVFRSQLQPPPNAYLIELAREKAYQALPMTLAVRVGYSLF